MNSSTKYTLNTYNKFLTSISYVIFYNLLGIIRFFFIIISSALLVYWMSLITCCHCIDIYMNKFHELINFPEFYKIINNASCNIHEKSAEIFGEKNINTHKKHTSKHTLYHDIVSSESETDSDSDSESETESETEPESENNIAEHFNKEQTNNVFTEPSDDSDSKYDDDNKDLQFNLDNDFIEEYNYTSKRSIIMKDNIDYVEYTDISFNNKINPDVENVTHVSLSPITTTSSLHITIPSPPLSPPLSRPLSPPLSHLSSLSSSSPPLLRLITPTATPRSSSPPELILITPPHSTPSSPTQSPIKQNGINLFGGTAWWINN